MIINRDRHNTFITIKQPSTTVDQGSSTTTPNQPTNNQSNNTPTTVIMGGSGMTEVQTNKLDSIEEGAEVNQNAFSYIVVQNSEQEDVTLEADSKTDTFKLQGTESVILTLSEDTITFESVSIKNLSELLDVTIVTPNEGDILVYNATTKRWESNSTINERITALEEKVLELETRLDEYEQSNGQTTT